jgi:large-conductance mechanosensitive channel
MNTDKNTFISFLTDNNFLVTTLITILSTNILDISQAFVDNLILPIFDIDLNNDGIKDKQIIENYKLDIFGAQFKIGKFLIASIKFIITFYVMYLISSMIQKYRYTFFDKFN